VTDVTLGASGFLFYLWSQSKQLVYNADVTNEDIYRSKNLKDFEDLRDMQDMELIRISEHVCTDVSL
jgi:hypothetical protein